MISHCLLILCSVHDLLFCINVHSQSIRRTYPKERERDEAKHLKVFVTIVRIMTFC